MPVTNLTISKRPGKSRPCHPFLDHRVFIDIFIVVVVDKPIPKRLTENHPDSQRNEDANPDDFPDGGLFPCFVIHWCLPNHLAFLASNNKFQFLPVRNQAALEGLAEKTANRFPALVAIDRKSVAYGKRAD